MVLEQGKGKGPIINIGAAGARLVGSSAGTVVLDAATNLLFHDFLRVPMVRLVDWRLRSAIEARGQSAGDGSRMERERLILIRAILETFDRLTRKRVLSPQFARVTMRLWARALAIPTSSKPGCRDFRDEYGCDPPWIIAVSPGHACNLRCPGCYANSVGGEEELHWRTFDRVITEARELWGINVVIITGGEPFARANCEELMSDEFLDFFFFELGAFYGFLFEYMPVGYDQHLELMPTPQQRLDFWRRSWEVISNKKIFLFDFWNHATLVHGCVSAGRERGYMHIDWDGKVMPCVFAQYSTANVHDIFDSGGNLNDIWETPFFRAIRSWQRDYGYDNGGPSRENNWLRPCPVRDHYSIFREWVDEYSPEPENETAGEALLDEEYHQGLVSYGEELARICAPVWESEYL